MTREYIGTLILGDGNINAMMNNSDTEVLINPERGCASLCLIKLRSGKIPHGKACFCSTEQMVVHAQKSLAQKAKQALNECCKLNNYFFSSDFQSELFY